MTKKYKLLKDLPDLDAGAIFFAEKTVGSRAVFQDTSEKYYFWENQIKNNPNWFEEVVEEERSIYFETKEVAKGYSFVIIRKNLTNDGQEDNLWSTSKAESIKRELEARCALTREDVEFLLENSYYLGREETSRRLQAILDATGGE